MTRHEALETVDSIDYFGMNTEHKVELVKAFINKIYDDFESRYNITSNCCDAKFIEDTDVCSECKEHC